MFIKEKNKHAFRQMRISGSPCSPTTLEILRSATNEYNFVAQYQQNPASSEWLKFCGPRSARSSVSTCDRPSPSTRFPRVLAAPIAVGDEHLADEPVNFPTIQLLGRIRVAISGANTI